jgi:hypothetical protein
MGLQSAGTPQEARERSTAATTRACARHTDQPLRHKPLTSTDFVTGTWRADGNAAQVLGSGTGRVDRLRADRCSRQAPAQDAPMRTLMPRLGASFPPDGY